MTDINFLKRISVKVGATGSDVIIKPCTDDYCYVFTDWHVIENLKKEEICVEYYVLEKDEDDEYVWKFNKEHPIDVYKKEEKDVAILRMPASMAKDVVKLQQIETGQNFYHVGFPESSREETSCGSQWKSILVEELADKLDGGFIRYRFKESQYQENLVGTSGGGVFTHDFALIGLYRGTILKSKLDLYDEGHLIPIKFFKNLIAREAKFLEPVGFCSWTSFSPFFHKAFYIDNGEPFKQTMAELSAKLDEVKLQCQHLSPKEIIDNLDVKQIVNKECFRDCFENEEFGVSFLEYIVCMHLIYAKPLTMEGVCDMLKHSLFIFWKNAEDDLFKAIENMNPSYLQGATLGQNIYIGGLKTNSYAYDVVKKGDKTLYNISRPTLNEGETGLDVANPNKLEFNYVNTCIFKDCIIQNIESFENTADALQHYKELLENKIDGKENV